MKTPTMKLYIHDCGRDGQMEIAVERNDKTRIFPYSETDLDENGERLSADFWKAHKYIGRLEITDCDLGKTYIVNVK
jgi:hypothetical protein